MMGIGPLSAGVTETVLNQVDIRSYENRISFSLGQTIPNLLKVVHDDATPTLIPDSSRPMVLLGFSYDIYYLCKNCF